MGLIKMLQNLILLIFVYFCSYGIATPRHKNMIYKNSDEKSSICLMLNINDAKSGVEYLLIDKSKHCTVTCVLTRRCGILSALSIGFIKEVIDAVGPGDCDPKDIKANMAGAAIACRQSTKTEEDCLTQCEALYNQ
jgi:hypothetical protein